ncbi:hypothetical protein A9D60_07565 [Leisingera sp. JC1]|nr:hypothetical protein A9D60_07565 [Leisingera sp. JC1]
MRAYSFLLPGQAGWAPPLTFRENAEHTFQTQGHFRKKLPGKYMYASIPSGAKGTAEQPAPGIQGGFDDELAA